MHDGIHNLAALIARSLSVYSCPLNMPFARWYSSLFKFLFAALQRSETANKVVCTSKEDALKVMLVTCDA